MIKKLFTPSIFLSLYLLGVLANAAALDSYDYPKKLSFRNIMQGQDIAIGEVEAIIQDYQGFAWLGGRNALLRYDGYEFLNIPIGEEGSPEALIVNQVVDLLEDKHHTLWVATRSGLLKYDRDHEVLHSLRDEHGNVLLHEITYALAESPNGELLIGSDNGLYVLNTRSLQLTLINHKADDLSSLPSNTVTDVYVAQEAVWLGLNEGLLRIEWATKKQTLFVLNAASPKSIPSNGARTVAVDHSGNVWAGTDEGIYKLNPTTGAIKHYRHNPKDPYSLSNDISRQIYVDRHGWVWTGSDSGGISLYDEPKDRFLRFEYQPDTPGAVSSNTIRRIYEDNAGDIWVGTYPSGVNIYNRQTAAIRAYRRSPDVRYGLLDNNVEAVEEDADGNLWIGAGGITRYNPNNETFSHYKHSTNADSHVAPSSSLNGVVDSDGEIRFGSWAHGILLYNPKKDRFDEVPTDIALNTRGAKASTKLNDQMVWSVYEDRQKVLWIGTHFNGLTKYDKKSELYTFYPHNPDDITTISCPIVWTSFEDSHGRFWVGTAYGLNLMDRDKGTFKRYLPVEPSAKGLVNGSILSIWEDRKGRLWFGTDLGLHLYHSETDSFTVYDTKDGFINQGIRAIIEDASGNLWLGTNKGVVMFNPDTKRVRNYARYNGELIGGIATGAAVATRKGEMVFGSRNGLYIFDANKLVPNDKIPPVALTDFRVFTQKIIAGEPDKILTKTITQTEQLTLDYTKSMISFSFAALNYREPEKNQYAYKLEGFDDKWRELGNQRSALYTNLPAGKYQFRVKASNNDGIWNSQGHTISITMLPPPWKTWWAYSIYTLIGLGLLLFVAYAQHKKILRERKTSRELEIKVAERTAQLSQKNEELEHAYVQLEAISLSDPLTGLNNRRYLQKIIPMDIAKVQREYDNKFSTRVPKSSLDLTFFLLDVDYFKSVNDTYGHMAGDYLLIELSEVLTHIRRDSDCVVRWGGEEFLIVSRFADREEAPLMAERIRTSIEQHEFTLPDGTRLKKTCSIGFACFPFLPNKPMTISWEQVIDIADQALYAAKKSGRNRSVGLATTPNTSEEMLYNRISSNIKELIDNNKLSVISINSESLLWG